MEKQKNKQTNKDHDSVWRAFSLLHSAFVSENRERIDERYLSGLEKCQFSTDHLPSVAHIRENLEPFGWDVEIINGSIPYGHHNSLQERKIFPMAGVIRTPRHLGHSPFPDRIHDLLGHLPFLYSSDYRELIKLFAEAGNKTEPSDLDVELYHANSLLASLNAQEKVSPNVISFAERRVRKVHQQLEKDPSDATLLERLYLWTFEFGLIGSNRDFRLLGAGLLSSVDEGRMALSGSTPIKDFGFAQVVNQGFHISRKQDQLFMVRDLGQIADALKQFSTLRRTMASKGGRQ